MEHRRIAGVIDPPDQRVVMRRKGEKPLDRGKFYEPYGPRHPVAQAIARGSRWFQAWQGQYGLTIVRLEKIGMPAVDQTAISSGGPITHKQVAMIAAASHVTPQDVIASLPDIALLKDT